MNKFNLNVYTDRHHNMVCTTSEEAEIFCNYLHEHGRTWCDGKPYTDSTDFEDFNGDVAYYFNIGCRQAATNISPGTPNDRLQFSDFDWEDDKITIKDITLSDFEEIINV